jgi:hypothetical protein
VLISALPHDIGDATQDRILAALDLDRAVKGAIMAFQALQQQGLDRVLVGRMGQGRADIEILEKAFLLGEPGVAVSANSRRA